MPNILIQLSTWTRVFIWTYLILTYIASLGGDGWYRLTAVQPVLSSILAFSKEFKPHTIYWTLFWGFGADKNSTIHGSGGRVQVWVQVWAPACHLAITPEGYSRRQSFVNNRLLCYWPTIQNSISKICRVCPKFQVLNSHFFKGLELLDEHRAKTVRIENISTPMMSPIYVECNKRFAFKNYGISCLALIFNLSNPRTRARQCTDTHAFICCALYNFSFWILSVAISCWQCFKSLHEHPTSTVLEHLESGPWPGLGHICGPGAWAWLLWS